MLQSSFLKSCFHYPSRERPRDGSKETTRCDGRVTSFTSTDPRHCLYVSTLLLMHGLVMSLTLATSGGPRRRLMRWSRAFRMNGCHVIVERVRAIGRESAQLTDVDLVAALFVTVGQLETVQLTGVRLERTALRECLVAMRASVGADT
jgi:hypothetical protein